CDVRSAGQAPREPYSCWLYADAGGHCALLNCSDRGNERRRHRLKRECLRDGGRATMSREPTPEFCRGRLANLPLSPSQAVQAICAPMIGAKPGRSGQTREVMGELDELRVVDWLDHLGHRGVVATARAALVCPQRLQHVVLPLVGEPGNIVPTGKVGAMT